MYAEGIGPEKIAEGEVDAKQAIQLMRVADVVLEYQAQTDAGEEVEALIESAGDLPEFLQEAEPEKPKKGRPAKAKGEKKKAAKCAHGVGKGINCWQCGGLAKIEGII